MVNGDAGLTVTDQEPIDAVATIDADRPLSKVWPDLAGADGFKAALVDAVRDAAAGRTVDAFLTELEDAGIDALHGAYRSLCVRTAKGELSAMCRLVLETPSLGHGWTSPIEDIYAAARLFALSDAVTPTVAVRIPPGFTDLRADQRRDVCELLAVLAGGCDVRLVAGPIERRYLATKHREDLPGVSATCNAIPTGDDIEADRVTEAVDALDPDGRAVRLLTDLAGEPSETLAYTDLYALHAEVTKPRVRQTITDLTGRDLVATFDGATGRMIELTPLGSAVVDRIETEIGRQQRFDECVSETGQPTSQYTCTPNADVPAPQDGRRDLGGLAESARLSRVKTATLAGTRADGNVVLVDRPIDAVDDSREYGFWFDESADRVYYSVEYNAAHQWWGTLARALVERLDIVLPADRIDDVLDEYPLGILRDARNLGCLSAGMDGEEYIEALREERDRLMDMLRAWRQGEYEDGSAFYGELLRATKGLTYTVVHLLDLAGVDVVLEARVPERIRHSSEDREQFLRTLSHGVAIQATYGEFAAFRQLYEDREDRREAAMSPRVDADDPHGEVVGTIVLSGPGVDAIEEDLTEALADPAGLHEDASEFDVPVTVATPSRRSYATAISEVCSHKNLDVTREGISVLQALTGNPYDAARAIQALEPEDHPRDIRLDELRYGLGTLPVGRILPDATPTMSKVVHALLRTEGAIEPAALAERADVSKRSIRRHADRLAAFDLIRETAGGYRLALNQREERYTTVLPWYARPNRDREDYRDATVKGVLAEVIDAVDMTGRATVAEALHGCTATRIPPPVRAEILDTWPWAGALLDAVGAIAADEPRGETGETVRFGADIEQASIEAVATVDRANAM